MMFSISSTQLKRPIWRSAITGLGVLAVATLAFGISNVPGLKEYRVLNETVRFPLSPLSSSGWTTENAFPELRFFEPTCVDFAKDGSDRVVVLERRGTVVMFANDRNVKVKKTILDISSEVWRTKHEDDGAVAIALHPEFGSAGSPNEKFFYLLYTAKVGDKRYDRLSRFTLDQGTAGEQVVLIDQEDDNIWHNGGALTFGPDGFLYVGVGDEGTNGDGLQNGQRIDRDLFCGILRIDVDQRGGDVSHPPRRQPDTGSTAHYFIPSDNPFVGRENVLEEFWAHGLRNPFRGAFDSETGELWVSDVGHLRREEINLIEKGGNYGWSYLEGSLRFEESYLQGQPPQSFYGTEQAPIWEYPHLNGDNCVIGGLVYRGSKHPELQGKYIYADNGSGRVWNLSRDGEGTVKNVEMVSLPVSSKTGIASLQPDADGEPLLIILGEGGTTTGTIRRLIVSDQNSADAIAKQLSETGLFLDLEKMVPSPGVVPYEVNASQHAGGARIRRWMMLPGDGTDPNPQVDRIDLSSVDRWGFPTGTVFVQHFELPVDGRNWQPIETRILVRHQEGGVYGLNYAWNESGTDASLVENADSVPSALSNHADAAHNNSNAHSSTGSHSNTWHFLDRQSCLACHNENAGFVLGVNGRQLNRSINRRRLLGSSQQLLAWSQAGMFNNPMVASDYPVELRLAEPTDQQANLDLRARSYLDVNCGSCHRPGGARAGFYASFRHTSTARALQVKPKQGDFGIEGAQIVAAGDPFRSVLYYRLAKLGQGRMPFVGSQHLDTEGLQLMRQWIEQMAPAGPQASSDQFGEKRSQQDQLIRELINGHDEDVSSTTSVKGLLQDTSGAFALWQQIHEGHGNEQLRSLAIDSATRSESGPARDLFEWYLPPQSRTQRLGTQFDLNLVLGLSGDAERGRQLYAESESLTCRNCHNTRSNGKSIGPSLVETAKKMTQRDLLHHIVYPSDRIDPKYATWMAQTEDGRIVRGLLIESNDEFVTLLEANGKEHQLEEASLEALQQSSQSMMPEHLLQSLTAAEAADLLEYLRHPPALVIQ